MKVRSVLPLGTLVQVQSCKDPMLWYNHLNGDCFEAEYVETTPQGKTYWVRTGDRFNTRNWIWEEDCQLLKD